ncbi:MAG: diguanylate cyclase [Thiovulaceae bacterium]|nr:diguanylate cyclase [Sulfurimonadaceae bacterium]MDD3816972.1 diguanylate cyclase [Sulfurimonadaceae bacterium]
MKHSIKKIFSNLSALLIFSTLLAFVAFALIMEQTFSFYKVQNLQEQKQIIASLKDLEKKDVDLAIIQFNGKSTQLYHEIDKLQTLFDYDFTADVMFGHKESYLQDLDTLRALTKRFNDIAIDYYTSDDLNASQKFENLKQAFYDINSFIDKLIIQDGTFIQEKSNFLRSIIVAFFVVLLFTTLWYRKRLQAIYADLMHLYSVENNKKDYVIFSEEADAVALRMKRKPTVTDNPAMLDPLTEINNAKGMMASYAEKKGMKDSNFTSVTVVEIDNFSKSNRAYSQEISQAILKKVAFTISLYEQPTDVVARTDYNQFTIILSRASKEQSFKDIDVIRQSISELKFKVPDQGQVQITVSGGFIIKPNNVNLEDAIKQAKEIMYFAQKHGKNKIAQKRDMAEHEL